MSRINLTDFVDGVVSMEKGTVTMVAPNSKVVILNPVELISISTWLRLLSDKKPKDQAKGGLLVGPREFVFKDITQDKLDSIAKELNGKHKTRDIGSGEHDGVTYHAFLDSHVALREKENGMYESVCFFHLIAPTENDAVYDTVEKSAEAVMETVSELVEGMKRIPRVLKVTDGAIDCFKLLPLIASKEYEVENTFGLFEISLSEAVVTFFETL